MGPTNAHKNIGLLLESVLNLHKKDEGDKKKKPLQDDSRSVEKISQKMKATEEQLKEIKAELIREKAENAENLKLKISLEKQVERLKKMEH